MQPFFSKFSDFLSPLRRVKNRNLSRNSTITAIRIGIHAAARPTAAIAASAKRRVKNTTELGSGSSTPVTIPIGLGRSRALPRRALPNLFVPLLACKQCRSPHSCWSQGRATRQSSACASTLLASKQWHKVRNCEQGHPFGVFPSH